MPDFDTIIDLLEPVNLYELSDDEGYKDTQLGNHILVNEEYFPDLETADFVLVGFGESRGQAPAKNINAGPNAIRKEFYALFHWHKEVIVADLGNIKPGATILDSY